MGRDARISGRARFRAIIPLVGPNYSPHPEGGTQRLLKVKIKMIQAAHRKATTTTNVNTLHLEEGSR